MDIKFNTLFEFDSTGRTRGHCLKLKKGHLSTDLRQHFFSERIINIWNRLESSAVESQSLYIFKSKLHSLHDKDESFLDNTCPTDSRGRASPPGEASSGELSGELG